MLFLFGDAMHTNQPSRTAENNAALRAFESMRSTGEQICNDPYAKHFVPETIRQVKDMHLVLAQRISEWDRIFPGVCDAILARTRFIDDCLESAIEEGLQQLVILGAGYDTRALRFDRLKDTVVVFELDHPSTQNAKLQRYRHILHGTPDHIVFVPVNFGGENLARKLFEHGYDCNLKSFFIWEGMTYYLSAAAVDETLWFISRNAPDRSVVVYDYFPSSVVDGTTSLKEAKALRMALKSMGEEVLFGLDPVTTEEFLNRRGFDLVQNFTAEEYKKRYFKGANRHRTVSEMFVFAHAQVNQKKVT
jgi:methyltransferase (TIGR00027 family)